MKKIVLFIMLSLIFISCEKDMNLRNQEKLLGKWISVDKSDTLDFTDNRGFYKSTYNMHFDHYDYQLYNDSIKIKYNGKMYVLVSPTKHNFYFTGNSLTINFSNKQCFGFPLQEVTYTKE